MLTPRVTVTIVALAISAAGLSAQLKVGDKAPAIKVDSILHPKMKSINETKGKLVLLDYFAFW
jgi:hypothetical protein